MARNKASEMVLHLQSDHKKSQEHKYPRTSHSVDHFTQSEW